MLVLWCLLIHFSKGLFCWPVVNNLHSDPSLSMHYPKGFFSSNAILLVSSQDVYGGFGIHSRVSGVALGMTEYQ